MTTCVKSACLYGIDGFVVDVECYLNAGSFGKFDLVGLPDAAVKESSARIKAAIKSSGIQYPAESIIINLAPADKRKEGSAFDVALLMGLLRSGGYIHSDVNFEDKCSFLFLKKPSQLTLVEE